MIEDKRFIEVSFPVKEVSVESAKEKNIRHGHISTLHIWWARRPLASSRATAYAALIPAPKTDEEWAAKSQFIAELSKWENSLNEDLLARARKDILDANGGVPPKVLDPFSGGGAIPLEAMRLGCETYANDLNPVATLILKCTLEYPQKFGRTKAGSSNITRIESNRRSNSELELGDVGSTENPLLAEVEKRGNWVLERAKKELERFYPPDKDGSIPVGYLWARTISCQNAACGAEIPLMRHYWLANRGDKVISLFPVVRKNQITFRIVGSGFEGMPDGFNPDKGTISRAVATCPCCNSVVDDKTTRKLFQSGHSGQRLVAVVQQRIGSKGKVYRLPTQADVQSFVDAEKYLTRKRASLTKLWGIDPVPDEMIPTPCHDVDRPPMYGMVTWGSLFNARQQLTFITLIELIRETIATSESDDTGKRASLAAYLSIAVGRLLDYNSRLCTWIVSGEFVGHTFARQALTMVHDYFEICPWSNASGDWNSSLNWIVRVLEHLIKSAELPWQPGAEVPACHVSMQSAVSLPFGDRFFDAVFTDPPYYDNVGYANLSDYFYVWHRRALANVFPEIFSTTLAPKGAECVADVNRHGGPGGAKQFFESTLQACLNEVRRVVKDDGIVVVVYAHKSTAGWETLINSLLSSQLVVTGAWPIQTEMKGKVKAQGTASLMSSIYLIAQKRCNDQSAFYADILQDLNQHLERTLDRLWQEGIGGADFFIAAIGSSMEVFGKYEKVLDFEGNVVRADRLLEDVRRITTEYAVKQILHNGFAADISDLARFYVLYRWSCGEAKVEFDEANRLAKGCSIELAEEWTGNSFIKKDKEFVRVLGPHERKLEELETAADLIDVLHAALLHWERGDRERMKLVLYDSGYGVRDVFYRVAQAISETLSKDSKEKKLLDGFLAGRERLREELMGARPAVKSASKSKSKRDDSTGELF